MVNKGDICCPKCGGRLKHYDRVRRVVRVKYGAKKSVRIRRVKCSRCGAVHRELPHYILPYKQYIREIIRGVVEKLITPHTLGFEDYPCEATMLRWLSDIPPSLFLRLPNSNLE